MSSRQSTTIILGLGALSLAGLILYLTLVKKKSKAKSQFEEPVLEFTVKNESVPFIVGKNEETLKNIEKSTGTRIEFKEQDSKHQLCLIRGNDIACIQKAQVMVKEKAENPPKVLEKILVPPTASNRIIGLCGERLEELCNTTNAKVWIDPSDDDNGLDTVNIEGTQAEINAARLKIEQTVKEDEERRKNQKPLPFVAPATLPAATPEFKKSKSPSPAPKKRITETPEPREVHPPKTETLSSKTTTHGQLEVYVSAVAHPSKFFVQMVGAQSVELDLLIDAMSEFYNKEENRERHIISEPTVGQMVAAKFAEDEKWYRAEIVAITENAYGDGEVLDLFYVDYGDNAYVFPKDVYALNKDFLGLKYQAMECFLAYVKPNNPDSPNSWPQPANDRFDELTKVATWKKLLLNIVTHRPGVGNRNQIPGVELFDVDNGADINIGQQLINEGLALPSTTGYFGDLVKSSVLKLEPESSTIDISPQVPAPPVPVAPKATAEDSLLDDSTNGNNITLSSDENSFNNNNFNLNIKGKEDTKKVDSQTATLDFLSGERQQNGNNNSSFTTTDSVSLLSEESAEQRPPKQVKQWSDLLKED